MSPTLFSHESRVLLCNSCGAPLNVHVQGGDVRCDYCGTVTRFAPRDEGQDAAQRHTAETRPLSESERIERLRAQDHRRLELPRSLASLLRAGEIPPEGVRPALAAWVSSQQGVRAGAPFPESERLFHLTLLLAPKLEPRHERALLENAAEVLSDRRYRQVLRCLLAQRAVLAGDFVGAGEWLETCNQRCTDLQEDSAFRLAASCLATARGDFRLVLAVLGQHIDEVPILDGRDGEAAILRANALEKTGDAGGACRELLDLVLRDPRNLAELRDAAARLRPLSPCPRTYQDVYGRLLVAVYRALRPVIGAPAVVGAVFCGAVALSLLGMALSLWEADPHGSAVQGPAFATIWGGVALVLCLVLAMPMLRNISFRRVCELTFARVLSVAMDTAPDGQDRVVWAMEVDLLAPSGPIRKTLTVRRATPVPLGVYPCLMDPQGRRALLQLDRLPGPI